MHMYKLIFGTPSNHTETFEASLVN